MKQYLDLLKDVLENGKYKEDRTGTGTYSVFGRQLRFDLRDGFPLVTTKKIHTKSVIHELLWLLSGDTNIKYLKDNGVTIWDAWADEKGNLGPVYGEQWRYWEHSDGEMIKGVGYVPHMTDQIEEAIAQIKHNPDSRRIIVSAWNVGELSRMRLPPCHLLFQFYVNPLEPGEEKRRLDLQLYQRSADLFLGVN